MCKKVCLCVHLTPLPRTAMTPGRTADYELLVTLQCIWISVRYSLIVVWFYFGKISFSFSFLICPIYRAKRSIYVTRSIECVVRASCHCAFSYCPTLAGALAVRVSGSAIGGAWLTPTRGRAISAIDACSPPLTPRLDKNCTGACRS